MRSDPIAENVSLVRTEFGSRWAGRHRRLIVQMVPRVIHYRSGHFYV